MKKSKLPSLKNTKFPKKVEKRIIPKAEIGLKMDKILALSTLRSSSLNENQIKISKSFLDTPSKEHQNLFVQKCKDCSILCDFSINSTDSKPKQIKTTLLKHLIQSFTISSFIRIIQPSSLKDFFLMLSINLFRPFPTLPISSPIDFNDSLLDSSWPHLSLVYESLTSSLVCPQISQFLTSNFLYKLINNGLSPDDREKSIIRDILQIIYNRFSNLRDIIRKNFSFIFLNNICSFELMEFFLIIVNGFLIPLKNEHIEYYLKYILPLHCSYNFLNFSNSFISIIIKYISKSNTLLPITINYIVNHWPCSDRKKQIEFINELTLIFINFEQLITNDIAKKVYKIISINSISENPDLCEIALDFIMNADLIQILKNNSKIIYPIILEPIYKAAKNHWDDSSQTNAYVTLQMLSEIDPDVFNLFTEQQKIRKIQKNSLLEDLKINWIKIFNAAKNADKSITSINLDNRYLK